MALAERVRLYRRVEEARGGRPLIVYVTSSRIGASGEMAADAIPELTDQVARLPGTADGVDLLVVSDGGDPTVAWRAVTLLRERVKSLAVLVPQAAYSAATLLALGADEIIMHPNGNLGPVDPQLSVRKQGETEGAHFGFEDMTGFLEFARKEVGLTDQEHLRAIFEAFCKQVGSVPVGVSARSSLLSLSMGEKLLRLHMTGEANAQRPRLIAESLNKAFYHHGYPISRREAKEVGLPVAEPNVAVEDLIWKIWLDVEAELEMRKPFNPLRVLLMEAAEAAKLYEPGTVGEPSEVTEALEFSFITAVMESTKLASRDVVRGKIMAYRNPDLSIQNNNILTHIGWESVTIPGA
jgi:hypothetical protein